MRYQDDLVEDAGHALRQVGLAGAGRAVHEDRAAGVQRRAELVEEFLAMTTTSR